MKTLLRSIAFFAFGLLSVAALKAQPANDLFANGWVLNGINVSTNGNSSTATREDGEPYAVGGNIGGRSVWFTWTAPVSGTTRVNTVGSSFNTILGIFTGNTVTLLTPIAANDNFSGLGSLSQVDFNAVQGTTYHIQLSGRTGGGAATGGAYVLNLQVLASVNITSPTNGSIIGVNNPININATASVPGSSVARVDFYLFDSLTDSDSSAPYSTVLSNAPLGTLNLYAVAIDSASRSWTSSVVSVTVVNPGVTITYPYDGSFFINPSPVTATVVTYLPFGTITNVDFYSDGQQFAQDGSSPFSAVWQIPEGLHALIAVGKDDSGNVYTSAPARVSVGETFFPAGSVWKYLDNGSDQGTAWAGLSFDDSGWLSGPAQLGYGDGDEATLLGYGPDPNNKFITSYFRRAFVVTNAASYLYLYLNVLRDDGAVVYINGAEAARFNMPSGTITYTTLAQNASDDGTVFFGAVSFGSLLVEGTNVVAVEIHQTLGTSSDISFDMSLLGLKDIPRNQPPLVDITAPTNNAYFLGTAPITLTAEASDPDGSVTKVEFYVDSTKVGEATNGTYTVTWTNVSIGPHYVIAVATDDLGATAGAVAAITVYDDAGTPLAEMTSPADGSVFEGPINVSIAANASAISGVTNVQFLANGAIIGNDTTAPYSMVWTNATYGTNLLTAVTLDAQGSRGTSAVVTVTVNAPPPNTNAPTVARVLPAPGSNLTNLTSIQVIFSEVVTGVDAADLIVNDVRATSVSGGGSNYIFTVVQPGAGTVSVEWASNHGIQDVGFPPLGFDATGPGATWTYNVVDSIPPTIASRTPVAGATVTNLSQITVTFSEPVAGVDAADLLVNGVPASGLSGAAATYTFNFSQPAAGTVNISWAGNHGIGDLATPPNPFNATAAGATWSYTLDNRTILVDSNSLWLFIKGTAEASNPSDAWRQLGFNDTSWVNSLAPFYYGDPYNSAQNPGTLLNDMLGGYSTVYFRRKFFIPNASAVTNLFFRAQSDDGFIAWINGVEVLRYNIGPGDMPYNGVALNAVNEPNNVGAAYISYTLPDPSTYLVDGTNVIAVHGFNQSLSGSSDFGFNAQLYTFLADPRAVAPRIASVSPSAGTLFSLTNITVKFTEPVSGVDANDLLINGVAASSVAGGTSNDVYTFTFAQPAYGAVLIRWAAGHGIADFDSPPKPFDGNAVGSTWQYSLLNPNTPTVVGQSPVAGASVSNLTQVTIAFSKAVSGVDPADLLVNGLPATSVSGAGATYIFGFVQPPFGRVSITWAANHGIEDLDVPPNSFDPTRQGSTWNYTLVDQVPPVIASVSPPPGAQVTNLTQLTVTFSESVGGVDASDLLVNGTAANSVSGSGAIYTFTFAQPGTTTVNVRWAANHGIHDLASTPNQFDASAPSATWTYTTPDTVAPTVALLDPPAFVTLPSLREIRVTFSEPVTGVDTNDFLINGQPARAVNGSSAGPYTFSFSQPPPGPVEIRWSGTHGITDLASPPNAFDGGEWTYIIDPNASFAGKILINEIMFNPLGGRTSNEWVELYNISTNLINLAGWHFTKGIGFAFPNVSMPAGGYLVVAADVAAFQIKYPGVNNVIGGWTGQLANSAETIELTSALGETVNSVHYATEGDWARRERGNGASPVLSITRNGATATVTVFNHGYSGSDVVIISGADQPEYNGRFVVNGVSPSTFNITVSGAPASPATGNIVSRWVVDDGFSGWSWFSAGNGFGNSLELVNPSLDNNAGQNWLPSASVNGTPGRANSVFTNNIAPIIAEVTHFPPVPRSSDTVGITARVSDELRNGVQNVTLFYRNQSTSPFTSTPMFDDGGHGDGVAIDGLYGAVLPPSSSGTVVEFYVQATDNSGLTRTWPAVSWQTNNTYGQFANALYQVDTEVIGNSMPSVRLVMTESENGIFPPSNRNSDAAMNATIVTSSGDGTQIRYLCDVRIRGAGTRTRTPVNNRVDIPNDNPWNGRTSFNLNSQFVHAQLVGGVLALKSGLPAEEPYVVQYRINGANPAPLSAPVNGTGSGAGWGVFLLSKPPDGDLAADWFPNDPGGNVYRASTGSHNADLTYYGNDPNSYLSRGYYKTSNRTENDWTDFFNLLFAFSQIGPNPDYIQAISTNVNVVEWMRYFALSSLMNDGETKLGNGIGDDYALYRGDLDKRFVVLAHDFDTIFGQGDTGPGYYPINMNSSIYLMLNPPNGNANVPVLRRFMTNAPFAPLFFGELKRLCDTTFHPSQLDPLIDQLLTGWGVGPDANTIASMKSYAAGRRAVVLSQIPLALTVSTSQSLSNGFLYTITGNPTLFGTSHAIDTRKVLVNGVQAIWSAWEARWTNTVTLQPGLNNILVQSLNSNDVEFASTNITVWYDTGTPLNNVSGTLVGSPIWSAGGGPYNVAGNLIIPNGVTLTIQPGTTVYVASGATITVNGTGKILAEGSASQHIRITRSPTTTAAWGSLDFIGTTVESRLAYIDFSFAGGTSIGGHNSQLHVNNSIVFIDHCTWPSTPVVEYISFDDSSFIVQNCYFPSYPPPTGPESLHGVNGIPANGYGIFRDNYFGHTWGFNDTIDFTGGNRPSAILQIINNVFDGASDDCLDLDSTDAWIEGNIFMHVHRDPARTDNALDTSSAISGGVDFIGQNSDWTIINNIFYDVDHVFLNKGNSTTTGNGGGRVAFLYNTVMHVAKEYSESTAAEIAAFDWSDDDIALPDASLGSGMYAAYNIIYDCSTLHHLYDPAHHTIIMDNNILSVPWSGPGSGNQVVDPLLNLEVLAGISPTNVTVAQLREAAQLRPGSPGIGAGFGHLNLGGFQPHGIAIAGEPEGVTTSTSATLTVGPGGTFNWGTTTPQRWGWTAFKWKLDEGPWSAEIPVSNNSPFTNQPTITLSGLGNGPHTVYVVGKNDAPPGYYQDDPFVYPPTSGTPARITASRTWIVNTSGSDLRLNEILASNSGIVDHNGTTPDLVELYNAGQSTIDLGGVRLTDDPADPGKFLFPQGATLAAGAYLVVYANNSDGTPGFHLGFNLNQAGDAVYLFDSVANGGALIDSVTFGAQISDLSIGRLPDDLWGLTIPTFGSANKAAPVGNAAALRINEWLAIAVTPFDNDFIELYNSNALPVNLGGLYLSDQILSWPDRHQIAPLSFIPGHGYIRFIADGDSNQGAEHLDFHLSGEQGAIGLFQANLTPIDLVMYQPQQPNISQGRSPNGSSTIIFFDTPTPGAPNPLIASNPNGGALVINEVLAKNASYVEANGRTPDWIELYNGTTSSVDLSDFSLSDDTLLARKFVFAPGTQLRPGGYLRVLCDDGLPASTNNTGFALKSSGAAVYLFDNLANGGSLLNSVTYGLQTSDLSIGRVPDGSTNWVLNFPSPGGANSALLTLGDPTRLRVNEWMADPASGSDWFEVYNPSTLPVAVGGLYLTDDLNNRTKNPIPPLSFIGTGTNAWQKFDADGNTGAGADHVNFSLKATGEAVGISSTSGALIDGYAFGQQTTGVSEGRFPDGSTNIVSFPGTDSPGAPNYRRLSEIVINEVLTHTDEPLEDAIELQNVTAQPIDIGGWWLSDDNGTLQKYQIPSGTILAPFGFAVFYESQFTNRNLAAIPFALSSHGDETVLSAAFNNALTGYRTSVKFDAADNGVSFGRYVNSVGEEQFVAMSGRTFGVDDPSTVDQFRQGTGASNTYPRVGPIVIEEIMYHPPNLGASDNARDEFIKLRNITTVPVPLYDVAYPSNVWHLRGAVDFEFPQGTSIPAGGSLVVVSFDPINDPGTLAAFRSTYSLDASTALVGPYRGKLPNSTADVVLRRPSPPELDGQSDYVMIEHVVYSDNAPWPADADGAGFSLQRLSDTGFANDPTNWIASTPNPGPQSATVDSDSDGIPDFWESLHNLDPHNSGDANLDTDGDGLTNLQEYRAGTDPRNALSVLRVASVSAAPAGGNVVLTFTAAANQSYSVLWKESIDLGKWTKLVDVASQPTTHTESVTDPLPPGPTRIYRVVTPALPGPANPLPAILSSPKSATVDSDGEANLIVVAVGNGPLSYQWLVNNSPIPNINSPTLTISNAQFSDAAAYTVRVTDSSAEDTSGPANLLVRPKILDQPRSQTAQVGDTVTFSISAQGLGTLSYRWRRNGRIIPGQTSSTLVLPNVQLSEAGTYSVTVTHSLPGGVCGILSSNAVLSVSQGP